MSDAPASKPGALKRAMARLHAPVYEARLHALTAAILPHLRAGDRVLDIGCGFGALGRALIDAPASPKPLHVEGLERFPRGGEAIPVAAYAGGRAPFGDASFDAVIIADVLHHEERPSALLDECKRLSRRLVIVKDHAVQGPLAHARISLIDWAANAPYGVKCLFRYNTLQQWRAEGKRLGLDTIEERASMDLYPAPLNLLFGRRLQYLAVWCRQ